MDRKELQKNDMETLVLKPEFLRFLFTVFSSSGMLSNAYGTDGRHLKYLEGRRSLGFDIMTSGQNVAPDILPRVLQAELNAQKEYPSNANNDISNPAEELHESDDGAGGPPNPSNQYGLGFLDYSQSGNSSE